MLIHLPLLGFEFPRLTGEVMRPLIALAKCDLGNLVKGQLGTNFTLPSTAPEFSDVSESFEFNVATYFNALYGSSQTINSIRVILILFAISGAAIVLTAIFSAMAQFPLTRKHYIRLLVRPFFLSFPLRITIQFSLFLAIGPILNFWLKVESQEATPSLAFAITVFTTLCLTQFGTLVIGLLPEAYLSRLFSSRIFYLMFSTIYDGIAGHRKAFLYVGVSLLRRSLFVLTIFVFRSSLGVSNLIQLIVNVLISFSYLIFLALLKPHESPIACWTEVFSELTFMTVLYAAANVSESGYPDDVIFALEPFGFDSFKRKEAYGYAIVLIIVLSIAIMTAANITILAYKLFRAYRVALKRCNFKLANLNSLEIESNNECSEQQDESVQVSESGS